MLSTTMSHFQCHQLPCQSHPTPVSSDTQLAERSLLLTKGQQEITMSWACQLTSIGLLSFSLLQEAHTVPLGLPMRGSMACARACPVSPALTPGPSAVITSHKTAGKSCSKLCKHRGYYASSVLVTVSSSLITVVMIGLWPVNSYKETSHYRRGRKILLWVQDGNHFQWSTLQEAVSSWLGQTICTRQQQQGAA